MHKYSCFLIPQELGNTLSQNEIELKLEEFLVLKSLFCVIIIASYWSDTNKVVPVNAMMPIQTNISYQRICFYKLYLWTQNFDLNILNFAFCSKFVVF